MSSAGVFSFQKTSREVEPSQEDPHLTVIVQQLLSEPPSGTLDRYIFCSGEETSVLLTKVEISH